MPPPLVALLLSALASWLLLRALIPLLRRRLLDQPNARSSHRLPTPRGGGVAVVLVSAGASALTLVQAGWSVLAALPLLALPLALVGLLDDRFDLPAAGRYGVQLATAALLLLVSAGSGFLSGIPLALWGLPLVVATTAVINFTNFMDGLDGLVAGCLTVTLAAASRQLMAPWPLWALVGSLLGFLLWNWSPARVFLGDVGSTFLGAVFAGMVLQAASAPQALGLLLLATPLLADALICVLRRLRAGQRIFQAHRLHLYQRLHQAGWPHRHVAALYIAATAALALAQALGGLPGLIGLAALVLLAGCWLDQTRAIPFGRAAAPAP